AADGFAGVEYLSPYEYPATEIRARLNEHGLTQVLFNSPFGDQAAGERGMAILAGRREVFRDGMLRALGYAAELDCQRIHVLSGIVPPGVEAAVLEAIWLENLRWAADQAASGGVTLQIEPINQRDMP